MATISTGTQVYVAFGRAKEGGDKNTTMIPKAYRPTVRERSILCGVFLKQNNIFYTLCFVKFEVVLWTTYNAV